MFDRLTNFLVDAISSVWLTDDVFNFTGIFVGAIFVVAALGLDRPSVRHVLGWQRFDLLLVLPLRELSFVSWQGEWSQGNLQLMNSLVILFKIANNCRLAGISFVIPSLGVNFISDRETQMAGRNQIKEIIVDFRWSRLLYCAW